MKNQRPLFRARSPDLTRNKLSDHTSHPRKHSRNEPDHRRSSEGGPFLNKSPNSRPVSPARDYNSPSQNTIQSNKHEKSTTKGTLQSANDKNSRNKFLNQIDKLSRELEELRRISLLSDIKLTSSNKSSKSSKKKIRQEPLKEKGLPPRRSKVKLESRKNKDFVLVGQEILAIQNSDQLEDMLKQRKIQDESISLTPKKTVTRPLVTIQKYLQTCIQCLQYEEDLKASINQLDIIIFHVKDLGKTERLEIYNQLKNEIGSAPQLQVEPANSFQQILRQSIKIIERKHHLAKLILDKLEVKQEYNDKLNKLNLWKSKRFREIMSCKTFLDLNKAKKIIEEDNSDSLKQLGALLQIQFDQLINQKFYRPINLNNCIKTALASKIQEETKEQRDTFALENPQFLPNKLIEQIKRVKEIKDAIKTTIDKRVSNQLGQGPLDQITVTQPAGIQTNMMAVNTYLVRLIDFILQHHQRDFLLNIKKCYGMNILSKLKITRNLQLSEPAFNEILSNQLFVEFQQQVIGIGDSQHEKKMKYFEHIHNKAVFDLLNYFLNTFRPFYANGQPLPWKSNSQFISSFLITQDNQADVLENARFSVLSVVQNLCGLLVDSVEENLLPSDLTPQQNSYTKELLKQSVDNANSERAKMAVNQDIVAFVKETNYEIFEVNTQMRVALLVFNDLIAEAIGEFF